MKFTEDDKILLVYVILGGIVFGLTAGAVLVYAVAQSLLPQNIYIMNTPVNRVNLSGEGYNIANTGNGTYSLTIKGVTKATLDTNIPIGIPSNRCFRLNLEYTRHEPIQIKLFIYATDIADCIQP